MSRLGPSFTRDKMDVQTVGGLNRAENIPCGCGKVQVKFGQV